MLEGATRRRIAERETERIAERETERCLFKKISILISAAGSTAGRGLSSPGCGCLSAPALHNPMRHLV
jgi:hypothetical protein